MLRQSSVIPAQRAAARLAAAAAELTTLPPLHWGWGYDDMTEIITVCHQHGPGIGGAYGAASVLVAGDEITNSPWYARHGDAPEPTLRPPVPLGEHHSAVIARFIAAALSEPDLVASALSGEDSTERVGPLQAALITARFWLRNGVTRSVKDSQPFINAMAEIDAALGELREADDDTHPL